MLVIEAPSRRTCTLEVTPLIAWDIEVAVPLLEEVAMKAQTLDYAAVQKIRHLIMVLFGTSFGALGDLACTALICNFLPAVTWQCYFAILCVFACVVTLVHVSLLFLMHDPQTHYIIKPLELTFITSFVVSSFMSHILTTKRLIGAAFTWKMGTIHFLPQFSMLLVLWSMAVWDRKRRVTKEEE